MGVFIESSPLTAHSDEGSLTVIEEEEVGFDNVYSREWLEVETAVDVELLDPSRVCGRYWDASLASRWWAFMRSTRYSELPLPSLVRGLL